MQIYDKIVFDDQFTGIGKVAKDAPLILLNGFSKGYLMTGWRCGYICTNSDSRNWMIYEKMSPNSLEYAYLPIYLFK